MVFYQTITTILSPLMQYGPVWTIVIVSLFVSLLFSLINRLMVDPKEMKHIKEKLKQLQELTKEARKEGKDKKIKELFEKSMEHNQKMMRLQMKPLLVSMLFVILILPWVGATYGDIKVPVKDGTGSFQTKLGEKIDLSFDATTRQIVFHSPVNVTVKEGENVTFDGREWPTNYDEKKNILVLQNIRFNLPIAIPLLAGDAVVGWLGLYILVSVASTFLFRKLLGVD